MGLLIRILGKLIIPAVGLAATILFAILITPHQNGWSQTATLTYAFTINVFGGLFFSWLVTGLILRIEEFLDARAARKNRSTVNIFSFLKTS